MMIQKAGKEDMERILELQKRAFAELEDIYGGTDYPPLTETLEDMHAAFERMVFLKFEMAGRIIGAVRAYEKGGSCLVERLVVDPAFQNQGIGQGLMLEVERIFDRVERFELFTGQKSERNLHLYAKLGYTEFRREPYSDSVTLVYMEKHRPLY
jgi:GNAT superfamily N-acetyltransferase